MGVLGTMIFAEVVYNAHEEDRPCNLVSSLVGNTDSSTIPSRRSTFVSDAPVAQRNSPSPVRLWNSKLKNQLTASTSASAAIAQTPLTMTASKPSSDG